MQNPNIIQLGSLVKMPMGKVGIVIEYDYRRDHHYLDRDLWLLVCVENKNTWVRSTDIDRV